MEDKDKTREQLIEELSKLRQQFSELKISESQCRITEASLHDIERKYTTLLANIPQKIFYKDLNSVYVMCNKSYARDLKIEPNQIIGKTDYDFYPKNLAKKYRADDSRIIQSGQPEELEEKYVSGSQELFVHTFKAPVRDEKGNIVGIFGIFWDITERKKISEEMKNLAKFPSENPSPVLRIAKDGVIMYANSASQIFLDKWKCRIGKHVPSFLSKLITETLQSGKNKSVELENNNQIFLFSIIPVVKSGYANMYGFDITERKETEKKLATMYEKLIESNRKLRHLVVIDPQTGLFNYRYFENVLESEFSRAKRYVNSLSIIIFDIDYFKSINDVYGHKFADLVLKQFAKQLKNMVRQYDIVSRFAGEEFVIISPGTDREKALFLAQRILDAMNLYNFGNKKHIVKLKLSAAVCAYPEDNIVRAMGLVECADRILNRAKEYGGNRVCSYIDLQKKEPEISEKAKKSPEVRLLRDKIDKLRKRTNQNLIEAIFAFAKTIELKDHYTGEHVEKTVKYAVDIARTLKLTENEIERVRKAAILHDLGKIGISEKVLQKKAKLTAKEFEEIKKHPQIAADIIRPIQFLHDIIPLIFHHHERWDGKGYPGGLRGEEIPIGARIVAVADAYQALISDRSYRKAYSKQESIKILKRESGTKFDPEIIKIFLDILKKQK